MTKEYTVYEYDGAGDSSFIASVEADSIEEAIEIAHEEYGAPISVE